MLEKLRPDEIVFVDLLRDSAKKKDLHRGIRVHAGIVKTGLLPLSSYLAGGLVNMYAKCGSLVKAHELLDELSVKDVFPWTAIIAGYANQGRSQLALNCFERMQCKGISANAVTYTSILKACGSLRAAAKGREIHDDIVRQGLLLTNLVLGTALVDMYAKCGALVKARQVLEEFTSGDTVAWSALISGYAQQGYGEEALKCYEQMRHKGISPDAVTFTSILQACSCIRAADKGKQIHDDIYRQGLLGKDIVLDTALIDMYAKCGALMKAKQILDKLPVRNAVSWSALIAGYVEQGQGEEALSCFERMQDEGLQPTSVTFTSILQVCASIRAVDKGKEIHEEIVRRSLLNNDIMLCTTLVDMYAKCGALRKAQQVFDELGVRNVITWNALIAGYAEQGHDHHALSCYEQMQEEGLSPDATTFTCILKACSSIGAIDRGEEIHDEVAKQGLLESYLGLGNALVDMYAKCGALAKASQVLEELSAGDVVSWNTLIAGYAQQAHGKEAVNCFTIMQTKGLSPDAATFSCVLNACNRAGLVNEGELLFRQMSAKFGIEPNIEHYICMVVLFGHAGLLDRAVDCMKRMPSFDSSAVWSTLMAACHKWGDVDIGRWAFENAVQKDKTDSSLYICMANIYASAGMQGAAKNIEAMRLKNKAWKQPVNRFWMDINQSPSFIPVWRDMKPAGN